MSKEVCLSKESNMLVDFTKELISQYNKSLSDELKNFRYKINLNDSYERLVYFTNGKKMFKYTSRIKNSLGLDIINSLKNMDCDSDLYVENYITKILKEVNIQSIIINDLVDYMFRQKNNVKGIYRNQYDLNIADNSDLHFTRDCLEIDYILLSKPLLKYIDSASDKIDSFYRVANDLRVIGNGLSKQELSENEYKVMSYKRRII